MDEREVTAEMQESQQIARGIRGAGLQPGDRIAIIGGISGMIWARLAKTQIVANLPDDKDFWSQGSDAQSKALSAFASTGARVVVAEAVAVLPANGGWVRIGQTDAYLHALSASAIAASPERK